ncbi:phosphate ABC transporter permease subunit PstC [Candidatus Chloroploca asiatica]|uniref:Phosphate transport system permease protein n=1 Tax=Candidatus Chloroploca asiatica TaxID=1506545 RepID=A0A2H3KKY3_9CHLR|nr:phosphate ABC transporter permease subunit PstC [Candidatus Chloroploca asiatica]PDV98609.1 phosphate ABC transporter permease subunit PstC [Candidatus Chloroploca asiatica]
MADQIRVNSDPRAALAGASVKQIDLRKRPRIGETIIQTILYACGFISIFTTIGIVYVLGQESLRFFASDEVSLVEFFTNTVWQPVIGEFGILPLVNSTMMVTIIALLVAIPLGLAMAIYMAEYASERVRAFLKPVIELLAGIPTVVYGFFALTFVTPWLREIFGRDVVQIYNVMSAGLVVGILITPIIATLSEDALSAVPSGLRQASLGLGATKWETAIRVVVPAAFSGIVAASIVAMSRAIGETMVVALAAGASPQFTFNPFLPAETMTGHIARISGGDLSYQTIDYNSIFAIGLVLFFMTLTLNIVSRMIVRRFREVYE